MRQDRNWAAGGIGRPKLEAGQKPEYVLEGPATTFSKVDLGCPR